MAKYEEFIGTTHGDFKVIGIDNERHISKKRRLICECQKCGAKESILGEVIRKGKHTQCLSCIANLPKRMESFQGIAEQINTELAVEGSEHRYTAEHVRDAWLWSRGVISKQNKTLSK